MHNPYNYHLPVDDDTMFFGQEELLERLVRNLSASKPTSAAISGGRRCGKTSLLNKLSRLLSKSQAACKRHFMVCNLDLQRGRRLTCPDDFFLWVLEELGETWEIQRKLAPGSMIEMLQTRYQNTARLGPISAFEQAFQFLDTHGKRWRLVILLDESEKVLTTEWCDDLSSNLRALLSDSPVMDDIALVMVGATEMYLKVLKVMKRDSPLKNILDKYKLLPLTHEATLALARKPNGERLPAVVAEAVWEQSGGQPCLTQFILHEIWDSRNGALEEATQDNVQAAVDTFDEITHHFINWTSKIGRDGQDMYRFLAQSTVPPSWIELRRQFRCWPANTLLQTRDALIYHGLIHCTGRGKEERYTPAGHAYREWFLAAWPFHEPPESTDSVLETARRALQHLEAQAAGHGSLAIPPHLQIQLEDKRREVAELEAKLKALDSESPFVHSQLDHRRR